MYGFICLVRYQIMQQKVTHLTLYNPLSDPRTGGITYVQVKGRRHITH